MELEALKRHQPQASQQMFGELTASIAHEINQPLAAIIANCNACQRWLSHPEPVLDEARDSLTRIIRDARSASDLIHRIRKVATTLRSPTLALVDLDDTVRETLEQLADELIRERVEVRTHLSVALPPVWCDRVQLQQVLLNLCMNALDAMKSVVDRLRVLTISAAPCASDNVEITVGDSGTGIAADDMPRIFEPFFTTRSNGMGLGLSLCRRIIEAAGGRIWVYPDPDHGTKFVFTLPTRGEP
jgi:signal transduction histidine kinase